MREKSKWEDSFDAISFILKHSRPQGLEVECIYNFIEEITSPNFNGDFMQAASNSLYEWDI